MLKVKLLSKYYDSFAFGRCIFPKYEFHIAGEMRKKYDVDDEFFSITGNVVFLDNRAVRKFVKLINDKRPDNNKVKTGEVNAIGLLDEIYHFMFRLYEIHVNPGAVKKAHKFLVDQFGEKKTKNLLYEFCNVFPPSEVFSGKTAVHEYLSSSTAGRSNEEITLEEMILLSFMNLNPASKNLLELFDENYLSEKESYKQSITKLDEFFKKEPKFGPDNQDLFEFLKTPIMKNPDNLEAQLEFIKDKWGVLLDEKFLKRILSSKDLIREDITFDGFGGGGAPTVAPKYKGKMTDADFLSIGKSGYQYALDSWKDYEETENFTRDIDWMPKVVIIAKNVYVWMDQLSKKYNRSIKTLDQVPDEELEQLARWGFNGLWLIGIWERSNASRKIKHIMGNIDSVASAYSLYDYQIAWDIGGENAYQNLNHRARSKGIQLASDMVPNHTGIFSKWVVEHPGYFIQSDYPPFPSYRFTGPDLSDDQSIQLRIEDGYWSRTDAAVVFQRIDNRTGEIRYFYHGNDGTNMPWNDTAQLNMLNHDVREAVIQKIFEVARKFSIIRFDAAMTLTKKHFSRLWYPSPGRGGDIPSRSDYALTQDEFDKLFPVEFWREVVDRINNELPDTLLLAEAFWLMEGYFVRTLGMHRVYNSAFMHMMMKEENAKYRDLITNTLEFEPEILKRYVNFMSNPDEETAIKQFGTDDKYFGVCTLMVTLPGLPMFAHGQIEGYTEKYGMEYQRAYYHETPNQWLVNRHIREIFPLLSKRYIFSNVTNFWLFDFIDGYGHVNENVFAFTNSERGENALVFYNNKYEYTSGKIYTSAPKLVNKELRTISISDSLGIKHEDKIYYIFRENVSDLEFIKTGRDLTGDGFYVELNAFQYLVFMNFREVYDENGVYEKLYQRLNGKGVVNISRAFAEMELENIHSAFEQMFDQESLEGFIKTCILEDFGEKREKDRIKFVDKKFDKLLKSFKRHYKLQVKTLPLLRNFEDKILAVRRLNELLELHFPAEKNIKNNELHKSNITDKESNYSENSVLFMLWVVLSKVQDLFEITDGTINKEDFFAKSMLDVPVRKVLKHLGRGDYELYRELILLDILLDNVQRTKDLFVLQTNDAADNSPYFNKTLKLKNSNVFIDILNSENVKEYIGVNEYEGIIYYSKENFEEFLNWIFTFSLIENIGEIEKKEIDNTYDEMDDIENVISDSYEVYHEIKMLAQLSGYRFEKFKEGIS